MTKKEAKLASNAVKDLLLQNPDGWREVVRMVLQEVLELGPAPAPIPVETQ